MAYEDPFIPGASQRIVSIEADGYWERGGNYTITWYYYLWSTTIDSVIFTYVYGLFPIWPSGESVATSNYTSFTKLVYSSYTNADSFVKVGNSRLFRGIFYTTWDFPDLMNNDITFTATAGTIEGGVLTNPTRIFNKILYTGIFTIAADATLGEYPLAYLGFKDIEELGPINNSSETQRVYYPITITESGGDAPATYPPDRPDNYDEEDEFDEGENNWTSTRSDLTTLGGGRYGQQIVVVSEQNKIYFGAL